MKIIDTIVTVPEGWLKKTGVKNPKPYVYGALLIAGGIVLFIVGKKIVTFITGGSHFSANTMNDQLSTLDVDASNLTINQADATIITNNLLVAMNWYGTDEQAIFDNLNRLQTKDDLMLIVKTFGIKLYDGFGLGEDWFSRKISTPKDLSGWLRAELSGGDLTKAKAIFDNLNVPF
jgi:hypothetical protein